MRIRTFLETKLGVASELLLFFTVALSTLQLGVITPILILILIVIGSLRTRKLRYSDIGLIKTDFKLKNILLGIGLAFFYVGLFYFIEPFLSKFTSGNLPEVFDIK